MRKKFLRPLKHRCRLSSVLGAVVLSVFTGDIATVEARAAQLPTLTTAKEAHNLPLEEAARAYPVRLKAVVTYYDPYVDLRRPALFVHDATGSVFVALSSMPKIALQPGDLLEISGVSGTGDFAPIVAEASALVIGRGHVPINAEKVSLSQLLTGTFDGQWVELEGVVHSVAERGMDLDLVIATSAGSIIATTVKRAGVDYLPFIDSRVTVHASAAPEFNRRRQMTGVRLFFPSVTELKVSEPAVADPFTLPVIPANRLLRFTSNIAYRHRVHVRGRVTLQWPGRSLCLEDDAQGLCVQTAQTTRLTEGTIVDLAGFPAIDGLTPTLTDATFRSTRLRDVVSPTHVTAKEALRGDYDAKLVQIEGTLIGKDRVANDPTLVLSSGNFLFPVLFPNGSTGGELPVWDEGSKLRITGICSVSVGAADDISEGFSVPASFHILLRSPRDVEVLERPSWWTASHLLRVLAGVLATALGALGWVAVLRHRVGAQSGVIREQNEALKELSFQDGLTRISNRRKFDETMESELGSAAVARTPLSLLMLDIDHFKALNDEYGHQCGDDCLVRVARALVSASVRNSDLVARYGGEEFAVILPGCDEAQALAISERMRTAVLDLAILNRQSPFKARLSISVGAATLVPDPGTSSASLIALADRALYKSKVLGRNRTTLSQQLLTED